MVAHRKSEVGSRSISRAVVWRLRTRTLELPRRPLLMGIVNVTPDSFSDGGQFLDSKAAIAHTERLAAEGADLLDIGGESTRPGSQPILLQEELDRVMPVVETVCRNVALPVSVDTSKSAVAAAAIAAGAEVINDITALRGDPKMVEIAAQTGAAVVAMHMQGMPATMQDGPRYANVVEEVIQFLRDSRDRLVAAGIAQDRIALDPGIGFGKSTEHNVALLANCWRLHELGCPVMVGHSRKSSIGNLLGDISADRTAGTIGVACGLAAQGIQILRVHDVAPIRQALTLFDAVAAAR